MGKVFLPLVSGLLVVVGDIESDLATWGVGRTEQFHSCLLRGSTGLASIAGYASTNHISPRVLAIEVSRDNVVQGNLPDFLTAILAGILVAVENLKASQLSLWPGALNHVGYSDY